MESSFQAPGEGSFLQCCSDRGARATETPAEPSGVSLSGPLRAELLALLLPERRVLQEGPTSSLGPAATV